MQIGMLRDESPVKPTRFVVLAIRVIVPLLGAPHLVAHRNHWQTQREQRHGEKILHLTVSQLFYRGIVGWPLDTTIPPSLVISAIAVAFAVHLLMLLVV